MASKNTPKNQPAPTSPAAATEGPKAPPPSPSPLPRRPDNGIVIFAHRAYNQRDELVGSCKRSALMLRKPR